MKLLLSAVAGLGLGYILFLWGWSVTLEVGAGIILGAVVCYVAANKAMNQ